MVVRCLSTGGAHQPVRGCIPHCGSLAPRGGGMVGVGERPFGVWSGVGGVCGCGSRVVGSSAGGVFPVGCWWGGRGLVCLYVVIGEHEWWPSCGLSFIDYGADTSDTAAKVHCEGEIALGKGGCSVLWGLLEQLLGEGGKGASGGGFPRAGWEGWCCGVKASDCSGWVWCLLVCSLGGSSPRGMG